MVGEFVLLWYVFPLFYYPSCLTVQAISHGNTQPASSCNVSPWANTRLLVLSSGEGCSAALLLFAISLVVLQFGFCMQLYAGGYNSVANTLKPRGIRSCRDAWFRAVDIAGLSAYYSLPG